MKLGLFFTPQGQGRQARLLIGQRSRGRMALYRRLNEINRVFLLAYEAARHGRDGVTSTR